MTAAPLEGRVAVVTGGGRGIGAAVAAALAEAGADLALVGRNEEHLRKTSAEISKRCGRRVEAVTADVSDAAAVTRAFAAVRKTLGDPHVLVNNAGFSHGGAFLDITPETWSRLLSVNLLGAVAATREVLPAMVAGGDGRIVNIASISGITGRSHTSAYAASKHALVGFTRALAAEVGQKGITVNAVCPGYTDTDMAQNAVSNLVKAGRTPDEARATIARTNPQGRLIRPEEVASVVAWLCSPEGAGVTGQAIVVGGG